MVVLCVVQFIVTVVRGGGCVAAVVLVINGAVAAVVAVVSDTCESVCMCTTPRTCRTLLAN